MSLVFWLNENVYKVISDVSHLRLFNPRRDLCRIEQKSKGLGNLEFPILGLSGHMLHSYNL